MKFFWRTILNIWFIWIGFSGFANARAVLDATQEAQFIQKYALKYHLSEDYIKSALNQAVFQPSSYNMQAAIYNAPSGMKGKSFAQYRRQFINPYGISAGEDFMCEYRDTLAQAETKYGVPSSVIIGIIGVETSYGSFTGHYRVIDTLATLAFNSPRRIEFWQDELAKYLLMCYQYDLDVGDLRGAIDGGFGIGQFMPSAYLEFAVSAKGGNVAPNLMRADDAIMSIANYLKQHGWKTGAPVAWQVKRIKNTCKLLDCDQKEVSYTLKTWQKNGVIINKPFNPEFMADLITFDGSYKDPAWLAFDNFYTIFSYNHSPKYAMAVYQLGTIITNNVAHFGC
ncbi:MAG: lytic murein transglycosylase [Burkholderiales bacterium]|nr:lytic murein transglycosylase [Burkholderiales bacterium]